MKTKEQILIEALEDIATYGCRHDLTPTKLMPNKMERWTWEQAEKNELWWHEYIKSMDSAIRDRARKALEKIKSLRKINED